MNQTSIYSRTCFLLVFLVDLLHFLLFAIIVLKEEMSNFPVPEALELDDYTTYCLTVPYMMTLAFIFLTASTMVWKLFPYYKDKKGIPRVESHGISPSFLLLYVISLPHILYQIQKLVCILIHIYLLSLSHLFKLYYLQLSRIF